MNQAVNINELPKLKVSPQVGQSVAIAHQVKRDKAMQPVGLNKLDRPHLTHITAVYIDGSVRTGTSDSWEVKLAGDIPSARGAMWVTINPDHALKAVE